MSSCATCGAAFGTKFSKFVCSGCGNEYCSAHLLESKHLQIDPAVQSQLSKGDGLCYECIFILWGKTDSDLQSPTGIAGRWRKGFLTLWEKTRSTLSKRPKKTDLVKINKNSFEGMNSNLAFAVFRHQKNIGYDFIIQDLTTFARLYSVSVGRKNEKDFCLKDVYRLIDWLRSHPTLPDWAHGVSWDTIESSPDGMSYVMDIWHVVGAAISLSNPATGLPWAAYHVSDRVVDQAAGGGIFLTMYDKLKDKLGLNINPKKALVSYLAGRFILQLFKGSQETQPSTQP